MGADSLPPVWLRADANAALVEWLRTATDRPRGRFWTRRRVPTEELRCHPDLVVRLEALAARLPNIKTRYVRGIPVLIAPGGAVFALAAGTTWIVLRLPMRVHSAVVRSDWGTRGLEGDWIDVDPWLSDLPAREGLSRLRGWCRAAYEHVVPVRTPPGR
jgi:hypothetical protein